MIIMGSLFLVKGQISPLTPEQKERLAALENIRGKDIDYSDIPPLTDEELARMKPARLRGEIWKRYKVRLRPLINSLAAGLVGTRN